MTREEIAHTMHARECYWCRLGSPRCDGTPTAHDTRRAADWLAMARIIIRQASAS